MSIFYSQCTERIQSRLIWKIKVCNVAVVRWAGSACDASIKISVH